MPTPGSSIVSRATAAAVVGAFCFFTDLVPAEADATLAAVRSIAILQETNHALSIDIDGTIARVESTQTLVNTTRGRQQAIYTFELPGDAVITGFALRLADGSKAKATVVDSEAALHFAPGADALAGRRLAPDSGLLRLVEYRTTVGSSAPGRATYEMRLFPLPRGKAVTAQVSWIAPLRYRDGRLSLRVPGRGDDPNLVSQAVKLTVTPPDGSRGLGAVYAGGKLLATSVGKRGTFRLVAPRGGDLVIEAVPTRAASTGVLATFAAVPITKHFGALAVNVVSPLPRKGGALNYERVVIAVDVSRSMGAGGIAAAQTMVNGLLAVVPPEARVQIVVFDRRVRRVFAGFRANDATTRAAAVIPATSLRNGSDLGGALDEVRRLIEHNKLASIPPPGITRGLSASTLVAVISDNMLPLDLDADRAIDRIGDKVIADGEVLAVTVVPDATPVPDLFEGPLAGLARRTKGRAIGVRYGEASDRAKRLGAELGRPPPLEMLDAAADKVTVFEGIALSQHLASGNGTFSVGFYLGQAPKKLVVTATSGRSRVRLHAHRAGKAIRRTAVPLALREATPRTFALLAHPVDQARAGIVDYETEQLDAGRATQLALARKIGILGERTALVALDRRDGFAKDRLAMAAKWGPSMFFRMPTPAERQPGHTFRALEVIDHTTSASSNAGPAYGRTGTLDRKIIGRLIERHVHPKAKNCYDKALKRNHDLRGTLTLVLEVARGEVHHVSVEDSTFPGTGIEKCIVEAGYTIRVPRVALDNDPETIGLVRYPLSFRMRQKKTDVSRGNGDGRVHVDPDAPLLNGTP